MARKSKFELNEDKRFCVLKKMFDANEPVKGDPAVVISTLLDTEGLSAFNIRYTVDRVAWFCATMKQRGLDYNGKDYERLVKRAPKIKNKKIHPQTPKELFEELKNNSIVSEDEGNRLYTEHYSLIMIDDLRAVRAATKEKAEEALFCESIKKVEAKIKDLNVYYCWKYIFYVIENRLDQLCRIMREMAETDPEPSKGAADVYLDRLYENKDQFHSWVLEASIIDEMESPHVIQLKKSSKTNYQGNGVLMLRRALQEQLIYGGTTEDFPLIYIGAENGVTLSNLKASDVFGSRYLKTQIKSEHYSGQSYDLITKLNPKDFFGFKIKYKGSDQSGIPQGFLELAKKVWNSNEMAIFIGGAISRIMMQKDFWIISSKNRKEFLGNIGNMEERTKNLSFEEIYYDFFISSLDERANRKDILAFLLTVKWLLLPRWGEKITKPEYRLGVRHVDEILLNAGFPKLRSKGSTFDKACINIFSAEDTGRYSELIDDMRSIKERILGK